MTVCKVKDDDIWIHLPNKTEPSKTICGKRAIGHHLTGSIGQRYTIEQVCPKCYKKEQYET